MNRPTALVLLAVLACAVAQPSAQKVAPADVLRAAAEYVETYSEKLQAVGAEEDYLQLEVSGGRMRANRRLGSDVTFVGLGLGRVAMYRDVFNKDGNSLRPREPRLLTLLQSTDNERLDKVQHLTDECVRQYVSQNVALFDEIMAPLALLRTENAPKVTFKLDSMKTVGGVQVATLRYSETTEPHVINSPIGDPATGRVIVEVATGIVRETQIVMSNKSVNLRITVTYALEPGLGLWLPSKMYFQSDISSLGGGNTAPLTTSTYNIRESLEGQATYSKYQQVSIKLNVRVP